MSDSNSIKFWSNMNLRLIHLAKNPSKNIYFLSTIDISNMNDSDYNNLHIFEIKPKFHIKCCVMYLFENK